MRFALPAILFAATILFVLGVTQPLLTVERLYFFNERPSLVGMIGTLMAEGDWAIAGVIALFSLIFPAAKLLLLHIAAYGPAMHRPVPAWFRALANWSMMDVLLVAIVIFAAKTSGLATAVTQPGLWFFAGSVVLTVAASWLVKRPGR